MEEPKRGAITQPGGPNGHHGVPLRQSNSLIPSVAVNRLGRLGKEYTWETIKPAEMKAGNLAPELVADLSSLTCL